MSDFVDFLHVVICILLDIHWSYNNMLFCVGIVWHRLSFNQILRYQVIYEVLSWFFDSIEAIKNIMLFWVMTPKYSCPISFQDSFLFLFFGLLMLIPGFDCCIVLVYMEVYFTLASACLKVIINVFLKTDYFN